MESGSTAGVSDSISARTSRADLGVFRHVRRDDDGVRAGLQRLEHRHGRAHAVGARHVAGRRHHAALAAADDDGLVGEARIVALLHRGVEGVAIDVRDGERHEFGMHDNLRTAAMRATVRPGRKTAEAVTTKRGPRSSPQSSPLQGNRTSAVAAIIRRICVPQMFLAATCFGLRFLKRGWCIM